MYTQSFFLGELLLFYVFHNGQANIFSSSFHILLSWNFIGSMVWGSLMQIYLTELHMQDKVTVLLDEEKRKVTAYE